MKIHLPLALVGLAISFAVPAFAQQTNTPDPELRQQIIAVFDKFNEAWNKNDAAALAALYTEDAVFCGGDGSGPHYGRDAIEKHFAEGFKRFHFSNHRVIVDQFSPHIIGTTGNEVWAFGEWSMTIQGQNGGPRQMKGYSGNIFVREGDAWKARMIVANDIPPAQTK
ncbi:MAG: nuclear transport factor 2 family protein [Terrimicrobiaceae bacterium]